MTDEVRRNMDELAKIIHASIWSGNGQSRTSLDACLDHANAVRAYLENDEVVSRAAAIIDEASGDIYAMCEYGRPFDFDGLARAALQAAGGKPDA